METKLGSIVSSHKGKIIFLHWEIGKDMTSSNDNLKLFLARKVPKTQSLPDSKRIFLCMSELMNFYQTCYGDTWHMVSCEWKAQKFWIISRTKLWSQEVKKGLKMFFLTLFWTFLSPDPLTSSHKRNKHKRRTLWYLCKYTGQICIHFYYSYEGVQYAQNNRNEPLSTIFKELWFRPFPNSYIKSNSILT